MTFIEGMRGFIKERQSALDQIKSEDQAKLALVFPLLRHLGYDTTDPNEVIPEYTADVGTKKGEKVDVAIKLDGQLSILVECKAPGADLNSHNSQLYRYFSVTSAKFAILTDGCFYWFFSDTEEANKLDARPFTAINLFDATDNDLYDLQNFEKTHFDRAELAESAEQLKHKNLMKDAIARELREPSDDLVRLFAREVFSGKLTQGRLKDFRTITQNAIREYMREYLNSHLQKAMDRITDDSAASEEAAQSEPTEADEGTEERGVTEEEEDTFRVAKAILSRQVQPERLTLRDGKTYNTLLLDGRSRQRIALFRFGARKKIIEILDGEGQRVEVNRPDDLYKFADALGRALAAHLE